MGREAGARSCCRPPRGVCARADLLREGAGPRRRVGQAEREAAEGCADESLGEAAGDGRNRSGMPRRRANRGQGEQREERKRSKGASGVADWGRKQSGGIRSTLCRMVSVLVR